MKEKSGSEIRWIIFSVVVVIVPIIFAMFLSWIVADEGLSLDDIMESIILVVFSVACSLFAVGHEIYKREKSTLVKLILVFSGEVMFFSWTFYIVFLTDKMSEFEIPIICVVIFTTILLSIYGFIICKQGDKIENEIIKSMHENCREIRRKLVPWKKNEKLKAHDLRDYDLICNPKEFDRVMTAIKGAVNGEKR